MVLGILYSIYLIFSPLLAPIPNFIQIGIKTQKLEIFHFWSILVGRAGRSKNGRSHFKHSMAAWKVTNDLCTKFELNRMKNGQISPFLGFWPVGPVCVGEISSRIRIQSTMT